MSGFTAADLKTGGRLIAACDAVGSGHLRRAAAIFAEIVEELNREAEETDGLLEDEWSVPLPEPTQIVNVAPGGMNTVDLQMCARGVHAFSPPDPATGWRTCAGCGQVNITAPNDE